MVTIAIESLASVLPEMRPLFERHWREIATYDDIPLDPDYAAYEAIEQAGGLIIYTARDGGTLAGYAVFMVRASHLHYKSHGWALNDIFWVAPEFRGWGVGGLLMDFIEADMRARGVNVVQMRTKVIHPHLGKLLGGRGYRLIEYGHEKRL